jgi:membrane protein DedA with SNARE-associated domain
MDITGTLTEVLTRSGSVTGAAILGAAAGIKYVFPPFPADIVIVSGVFLIARGNAALAVVALAVLGGSAVGFMLAYGAGRWLGEKEEHWVGGWRGRLKPRIDAILVRFKRHGALYVTANRFIPAVRPLIFLAAGMTRLPIIKVLACGLLGAAIWNGLLFGLGITFGGDWSRAQSVITWWGLVAGGVIALVALVILARHLWRKRRAVKTH